MVGATDIFWEEDDRICLRTGKPPLKRSLPANTMRNSSSSMPMQCTFSEERKGFKNKMIEIGINYLRSSSEKKRRSLKCLEDALQTQERGA